MRLHPLVLAVGLGVLAGLALIVYVVLAGADIGGVSLLIPAAGLGFLVALAVLIALWLIEAVRERS
jgi:hypothetical protein